MINLINETVVFKGTFVELKSKLNQQRGRYFLVEWISENEFKYLSSITNGTAMVKGNPDMIDGIKGYAIIFEDRANGITQIEMSTKFRIELKFIIGVGIIWTFYAFFVFELIPILLIALFPLTFAWMYNVYRKQELELHEIVKKYIRKDEAVDDKL